MLVDGTRVERWQLQRKCRRRGSALLLKKPYFIKGSHNFPPKLVAAIKKIDLGFENRVKDEPMFRDVGEGRRLKLHDPEGVGEDFFRVMMVVFGKK